MGGTSQVDKDSSMSVTQIANAFVDEVADFLASSPSAQELVDFHPSEVVQRRASTLLAKNRANKLTAAEKEELDEFLQAELFMQLVKIKARMRLAKDPRP
jgi:hypothetical protein